MTQVGIAGEQVVVLGRAQEPDDAELDDEVVDDLLRLLLGNRACGEIALEVDVEERRRAAERHRRAVLLLHARQVAEVEPLHGLFRVRRRTRDVEAVARRHLLQFLERPDLFGQLLAIADDLVGRGQGIEAGLLLLLALDEARHAVERDTAVVADDPAATVGVGQAGQDVRAAAAPHVGRVGVEDAVVVRLAILGEGLDDVRVGLVAVGLERGGDHPEAAVRHDRALERRLGLQPDDDFVVAVDVARARAR